MKKFVILVGLLAFALAGKHGDVEYEKEIKKIIGKATDMEMDDFRQALRSGAAEEGVDLILNESNEELKKELLDLPERGMEHLIQAIEKTTNDMNKQSEKDEERSNELVSRCNMLEWLNETNEPCGMDDQEKELDD